MGNQKEIVPKRKNMKKQLKKCYQTPQMTIHGTIEKITGWINPGPMTDQKGGSNPV